MKKLAVCLALLAAVAIGAPAAHAATSPYLDAQSTDAPVHDRYAATARCFSVAPGLIAGMPVTAVMRDDEDAIDAAVQRYSDLGMTCFAPLQVEVVYIP